MEYHHWLLVTYDGERLEGVDNYPPEAAKAKAKSFVLNTAGSTSNTVIFVPKGWRLIFKRRVRTDVVSNTNVLATGKGKISWHYILGFEPPEGLVFDES